MKNNHLTTAIKSIRKQIAKYEIERDKFEAAEKSAHESMIFFALEIQRLEKQIAQLEGKEELKVA